MSNEIEHDFNDPELLELEKASYDKYDIVIQRVLPDYFSRVPNALNLLACVFETSNIHTTPWWRHLGFADAVLVPSNYEKNDLEKNNLSSPVFAVSEAIDISKYDKEYEQWPNLEDAFNFYFIGEMIERKNVKALLTAFHREFKTHEPVNLVVKTNGDQDKIIQEIHNIKANLRIYQNPTRYKSEHLICGRLDEQQMHNLHRSCHCMVMPSCGEAYCRPVVDALGYGNVPIVTDNTGMTDYITTDVYGWVVGSHIEPVYTTQPPISNIYTAKENWSSIDVGELAKRMRESYEGFINKNPDRATMVTNGQNNMQKFSYQTVGQNIQKVIDEITN